MVSAPHTHHQATSSSCAHIATRSTSAFATAAARDRPADPTMQKRPAGSWLILLAARYRRRRQRLWRSSTPTANPGALPDRDGPGTRPRDPPPRPQTVGAYADGGATVM